MNRSLRLASLRSKRVVCLASLLLPTLSGLTGLACGGATPEPAAAPKPAETKPTPAAAPDVSAVPAPSTLVVFGRVAKPGDLLKVVGGWAGAVLPEEMVGQIVASAPVGPASDLARPVDFAVATDPRGRSASPGLALSMAVRPLDESRPVLEKRFTIKAASGGIYRLEQKAEGNDEDADERRFCAIYPSADAPAPPAGSLRLVCATTSWTLDALGPYLARTAPREKYASDVHMEMTLGPFREVLNQGRGMFPALLAGALGIKREENGALYDVAAAAVGDLTDFALDLDKVQVDAKVADPGAEGTLAIRFNSSRALATRLVMSRPDQVGPAPAAFWRMPAPSDTVFFHRGIDEKEYAHARDLAIEALTKQLGQLGKGGLPEGDKNAIKNTISHAVSLWSAPAVFAKGYDYEAERKAFQALGAGGAGGSSGNASSAGAGKPDAKADAARADAARAAGAQLAGWTIASIEEQPAKVASFAKELAGLVARPAIAKWLKERHPYGPPPTLKETPSKLTATLPKGTSHYEITFVHADVEDDDAPAGAAGTKGGAAKSAPGAPGKGTVGGPGKGAAAQKKEVKLDKPIKVHFFIVPDGARSLVGLGIDDALVSKMLAGVVAGSGGLEQREGLAEFKQAKLNAGGFFDARSVLGSSPIGYAWERHARPEDPFRVLAGTPAHGATPVPLTLVTQPGKDGAGTFTATVKVSKAAVEDIIAASIHLGR